MFVAVRSSIFFPEVLYCILVSGLFFYQSTNIEMPPFFFVVAAPRPEIPSFSWDTPQRPEAREPPS